MLEIRRLSAGEAESRKADLAQVLVDCVEGGASVNFLFPFTLPEAEAFFDKVVESMRRGERILLAAFLGSRLVGTVQVVTALPPNQPHRAEIAKLLVARSARRQGVGMHLMQAAEQEAKTAGRWLLVLDTMEKGDAGSLYVKLGWTRAGLIPQFSMFPNGDLGDTVIFWKSLREA
jgi:GNAT superfamily N-acetyltransferase